MKIPPLPHVDCAILHDRFAPIPARDLFREIEAAARQHGFGPACEPMVSSTDTDAHVLVGQHRILVSQNPEPLGPDGFRAALATPFTSMVFPEAASAVSGHRANTFITVGKGPVSLPEEMFRSEIGDIVAEMSAFTTSEEAQRAYAVCQRLAGFVTKRHRARALHWCTSDNLVPQDYFEKAMASGNTTLLDIRPYLTSSAGRLGDGLPIGVTANGSQWLLGKMVVVEEAPVPLPWLLEMLYGFIEVCRVRGALLPHMDTFSVEGEDWQVGVFHEKIEDFDGWELVRLKVLHHPEFGIRGKVATQRVHAYNAPDDLRRRAAEETRPVSSRPGSMADLRARARADIAEREAAAASSASPGLFGRIRSALTGRPN